MTQLVVRTFSCSTNSAGCCHSVVIAAETKHIVMGHLVGDKISRALPKPLCQSGFGGKERR